MIGNEWPADPPAHMRITFQQLTGYPSAVDAEDSAAFAVGDPDVAVAVLLVEGLAEGMKNAPHVRAREG